MQLVDVYFYSNGDIDVNIATENKVPKVSMNVTDGWNSLRGHYRRKSVWCRKSEVPSKIMELLLEERSK